MAKLMQLLVLALVALCFVMPFVSASADENEQIQNQMQEWMDVAELQEDETYAGTMMMEISADAETEVDAEAEAEAEVDMEAEADMAVEAEAEAEVEAEAESEVKRGKLKKLAKKIGGGIKKAGKKLGKKLKAAGKKLWKKVLCFFKGGRKFCGGRDVGAAPAAAPAKRAAVSRAASKAAAKSSVKKASAARASKSAAAPKKAAARATKSLPAVKPLISAEEMNLRWETESAKKIATLTAPKIEYYHEVQDIDDKLTDITARAIIDTPERAAYRQRVKDDIRYAKTVSSAANLKKTTDAFLPKKKQK